MTTRLARTIHGYGLPSAWWRRAVAKTLTFSCARQAGQNSALGDEQIVFLRQGDAYLELFHATAGAIQEPAADGPQNAGPVRHIAFQTDDLDAFLTRIGDAVPISLGPLSFDDFIPGWRTVWLIDPDGVIVEVSEGYRDE